MVKENIVERNSNLDLKKVKDLMKIEGMIKECAESIAIREIRAEYFSSYTFTAKRN